MSTIDSRPASGTKQCNHEICDGNRDDPDYAYCGYSAGHAGEHGAWDCDWEGVTTVTQPEQQHQAADTTDSRTCSAPGDQEHDHDACVDAVADAAELELAQRHAAGLRALADMVEQNPNLLDVLRGLHCATHIFGEDDPKAKLGMFARVASRYTTKVEKRFSTGFASVEASFGPLRVLIQADRDEVCERVVTGTETVTKSVPDPAALAAVPTVEVTETVDTYEWVCRPLLADDSAAQAVTS